MLLVHQLTKLGDATDGTSNTLMVAEQSGMIGTTDIRNGYYGGYTGANFNLLDPISATVPAGTDSWSVGVTGVQYKINCPTTAGGSDNPWDANTVINSFHTGGVHGLLTDGSVRFLSNNIDFNTFLNVCSRNDGIPLGDY